MNVYALESALDDLADALREIVNVVAVQACHGNAAVGSHVDVRLLSQLLGLRSRQTSEAAYHADQHTRHTIMKEELRT